MSGVDYITRGSAGRTAEIGDLYDVRSEQLLNGVNIFKQKLPKDIIKVRENRTFNSEIINSNKISDKLAALNLHGELSVSFLAGLVKGSGSVDYINEKVNTKEAVQYSFIQKIRTLEEKININEEDLKPLIASNISEFGGTHVVVGISWGANAAVTMTYENSKDESKNKIEGELKIVANKFKIGIEGTGNGSYNDKEKGLVNKLTLKVHADMPPSGLEAPTNVEDAMKHIRHITKKIDDNNDRGKQLEFYLVPLEVVEKIFELQTSCDLHLVDIEKSAIKRLEQLFDAVDESSSMVKSLVMLIENNEDFITTKDKIDIQNYTKNFEVGVSKFRYDLGCLLKSVRSGEKEAFEIEILRSEFEKNPITSKSNVCEFVDSYKYLKEKIDFINECKENGIMVVAETNELAKIKRDNQDTEIYLLICSFSKDYSTSKWSENVNYFFNMQKNPGKKICVFVDTDILQNITKNELLQEAICVAKYFNGKYISKNCLEHQKKMDSQCLVLCDNIRSYDGNNIKAVPIDFPCPKSLGYGKCSKGNKEWFCANCREPIEYNFDGNFYCGCGYNTVEEFAFKCCDEMHGNDYIKFPEGDLKKFVENLKRLPERNILVIGETGVGKSTWINALANYITYETMDEVLSNEVINLIPTQFELTETHEGQLVQKSIIVGKSKNENFTKGQSSTQKTKAYAFCHKNVLYRLFDTPGICDSRGIKQDKKNIENMMHFISSYDKLHGICIVMEPNKDRLTPNFEFCFKELLVQFHRSAVKNIVFCFTQTSGFNFQVGQTLSPLSVMLNEIEHKKQIKIPTSEERMYPFDNMAYRYLCAYKHYNIEFPSDQQELYRRSYTISRNVTLKMLNYFTTRSAHKIEDSITIYRARNVILKLTHPMALINTGIEETIGKISNKQDLINKFSNDEEELKKILVKEIPFKRWILNLYDEYFCNTCSTMEYYYGDDRLQFVEADPSAMDKDPYALNTTKHILKDITDECPECGSNTNAQLGQKWLYSEVGIREEEDITVAGQMKEKLETRQGIEEEIKKVQKIKEELVAEKNAIVKASARFAYYLRTNSITTYNDATEKYLKVLIEKEEKMGTNTKKVAYENLLSQYEEEKVTLEQEITNSSSFEGKDIQAVDIMKTVNALKDLKHYGRDIANAIEECNNASRNQPRGEEVEVFLPDKKKPKSILRTIVTYLKKPFF